MEPENHLFERDKSSSKTFILGFQWVPCQCSRVYLMKTRATNDKIQDLWRNKRLEGSAIISSLLFWFIFFSRRPNWAKHIHGRYGWYGTGSLSLQQYSKYSTSRSQKTQYHHGISPTISKHWESWSVPIGLLPPLGRWVPLLASSSWHHMACESQEHRCELCPPNTEKSLSCFREISNRTHWTEPEKNLSI